VFFVPSLQKTFGEISLEEKNKLSHRAMAALSMQKDLLRIKDFLKA
jgi:inosine/xanthosine triphosphate pyrophosphatase family protein